MTRSLGDQLPDAVCELLNGADLARREGLTFLLLTTDEANWPHMAMLSVGEVVAMDERTLRAGLWLHSSSTKNLTRAGRGMLTLIVEGNGYYVRLEARRGPDLDLGADGRLAYFVMDVKEVQEDSTDYATLTSGVTFRLKQPEQVVPRWQLTVAALRAAAA
ncbi:MAG: pyridoxamine 5'-phosphate oxidase family protein [Chloroflexi bacterium]|nr:pyridoxamine 5'-phosphate oxidase family protein [Chloroflexota bacterium]